MLSMGVALVTKCADSYSHRRLMQCADNIRNNKKHFSYSSLLTRWIALVFKLVCHTGGKATNPLTHKRQKTGLGI